jgi:hypothetical protein
MKIFLIALSLYFQPTAMPTDTLPQQTKPKTYQTIVAIDSGYFIKGFLIDINDSAVILSDQVLPLTFYNPYSGKLNTTTYPSISYITLKRKGSIVKGTLLGTAAGFALGAIIAIVEGDDPYIPPNQDFFGLGNAFRLTTGDKMILYGLSAAVTGALTGLVIGALAKRKFLIHGKKENLQRMRTRLTPTTYIPY